jgi:hypothetical protein
VLFNIAKTGDGRYQFDFDGDGKPEHIGYLSAQLNGLLESGKQVTFPTDLLKESAVDRNRIIFDNDGNITFTGGDESLLPNEGGSDVNPSDTELPKDIKRLIGDINGLKSEEGKYQADKAVDLAQGGDMYKYAEALLEIPSKGDGGYLLKLLAIESRLHNDSVFKSAFSSLTIGGHTMSENDVKSAIQDFYDTSGKINVAVVEDAKKFVAIMEGIDKHNSKQK